jgi:hypothetical protein
MPDPGDNDRRELKRAMGVFAVSWAMAGSVLAGWLLGWYLDTKLATPRPLMTILGIAAGVLGGGIYAYRAITKVLRP